MKNKILIICINYNNTNETCEFIKQIQNLKSSSKCEIRVVDNSGKDVVDTELRELELKYKNLNILNSGKNLGYIGGANYALEEYLKTSGIPNYTILCNTDILIEDEEFLEKLIKCNLDNNVGVIAPYIKSLDYNINQNPFMIYRPSIKRLLFLKNLYKHQKFTNLYVLGSDIKKKITSDKKNNIHTIEEKQIYAPHGAFIIFTKNYFEKGGNFNCKSFLYAEELYIGEIARKIGVKVIYNPNLYLIHKEHSTTSKITSKNKLKFKHDAIDYILDEFYKI